MILFISLLFGMLAVSFVILIVCYARSRERIDLLHRLRLYTDRRPAEKDQRLSVRFMDFVRRTAEPLGNLKIIDKYDNRMKQVGFPILGAEYIIILLISASVVGIFTMLLTLNLLYAIFAALGIIIIEDGFVSWRIYRRRNAFTNQLSDCLITIANSLRAGFSFAQAIDIVSHEMEPPISDEFARVMRDMAAGVNLEQALENMDKRVGSKDFNLVVTAVLIQRQVGGNLAVILDNISTTITERIKMKREVLALTAQGRSSAKVVAALPVLTFIGMSFLTKDYLNFFIENDIGKIAGIAAIISEIVGLYIINRLTDLDA